MEAFDKFHLLAELNDASCGLYHGDNGGRETAAVNYLVTEFGYRENNMTAVAVRKLVIPICYDCNQALVDNEWTLLYCFECASSRWVLRKRAKNNYRHNILWLRGCPECSNEFGGLYFNDGDAPAHGFQWTAPQVSIQV